MPLPEESTRRILQGLGKTEDLGPKRFINRPAEAVEAGSGEVFGDGNPPDREELRTEAAVPSTVDLSLEMDGVQAEGGNLELARESWDRLLKELKESYGGRFGLDENGNLILVEGAKPGPSLREAKSDFERLEGIEGEAKVILGHYNYEDLSKK